MSRSSPNPGMFCVGVAALLIATAVAADDVAVVRGVVCDFFGAPLGGAQVRLVGPGGQESYQTNADASGRFSFRIAPNGTVRVMVTYRGFVMRERYLQLVPADEVELLVALAPGSIVDLPPMIVKGTARAMNGNGLKRAHVVATCDFRSEARVETQTDDEGHYTLNLADAGQYTVSASATGHVAGAFTVVLKPALRRMDRVVDFALRATDVPR